ncbi:hypothetical protein EDWATA_01783 [Edwardsiella tarda ATCC 23685]|uniref:Uncharacterized protein n=1 Tax=Edwardsiella tarda ATCC 23685 TaxID=500638 RepID=D4F4V6_EDWTA|nr:hypothetical protein EDWATA_01783 [Edwardsiella tarda ATCC 23685]
MFSRQRVCYNKRRCVRSLTQALPCGDNDVAQMIKNNPGIE